MDTRVTHSFKDGWGVFYQARTIFLILLVIAMVLNIVIFISARVMARPGVEPVAVTEPAPPATLPAETNGAAPDSAAADWDTVFANLMTVTMITTIVSVIFLVFCALLGVMMIVAGQLPGAGLVSGAFFWAIGIVVLLLPWGNLFPHFVCAPVAAHPYIDMQMGIVDSTTWPMEIMLWIRFLVIPLLIILAAVFYYLRTNQANAQIATITPIEPVAPFNVEER